MDETKLWRELLSLSNTVARVSVKIMKAYRFTIGQSLLTYCDRLLIDWHKLYRNQVFWYWSSSEYGSGSAWQVFFFNGNVNYYPKNNYRQLRLVRAI